MMSFGEHSGKKLKDIKPSFFLWLYEQAWFQRFEGDSIVHLRKYIKDNMKKLKKANEGHR